LLFEAESCFIAQAGLEFTILLLTLLPLLLEWWDYRCEPPCQAYVRVVLSHSVCGNVLIVKKKKKKKRM
jgi:hypothetical protein